MHRGCKTDSRAPDMRRQPDVMDLGDVGNAPPLPKAAAQRQVRLNHIGAAHIQQALEIEGRVERLAGRNRDGTRLPQTRIAVEVLRCERLLNPAGAILRQASDRSSREIEGIVRIDIDQDVDLAPKTITSECDAL
jgi:hypothetical protein